MNVVLVANGQLDANARLRQLWSRADLRIAADGGARNAREQLRLAPHILIGDLDSLDEETRGWLESHHAEFIRHPRAKDQTDLELALDLALARGATHITILDTPGGRIDQTLANILLLTREARIVLTDAGGEIWLARGETEIVGEIGETVSLIPVTDTVEGIATRGLVFPLKRESLVRGSTRGISNELAAPRAYVTFERGLLFIVHLFGAQG